MTTSTPSPSDPVARYQYLLRTASPDQLEAAHEAAFAQMSASERQEVLQALANTSEKPTDASAAALARSATRLEVQQPGALQQALNSFGGSGGLLKSLAVGMAGAGIYDLLFQNDGFGRPSVMGRLFGGSLLSRLFNRGGYGYGGYGGFGNYGMNYGQMPPQQNGGLLGGLFGGQGFGRRGGGGGFGGFGGGGFGGGGFGGGGFGGGPGGGGPGGGPGGPGGGPGGGGPGGPGGF